MEYLMLFDDATLVVSDNESGGAYKSSCAINTKIDIVDLSVEFCVEPTT